MGSTAIAPGRASTLAEPFLRLVGARQGNANALSCSMSPSNVNFSSWMLRGMFTWSQEIAKGQQPETDEAVSQ